MKIRLFPKASVRILSLALLGAFTTALLSCGTASKSSKSTTIAPEQGQMTTEPPKPVPAPAPHAATAPPATSMLAVNYAEQDKAILAHLNAVLRYWRATESPIQRAGEPSDLIYRNQAVDYAAQIATDAFQSATAEAVLMQPFEKTPAASSQSQAQRLRDLQASVAQRVAALKTQQDILRHQIAAAHGAQADNVKQQLDQVQGELELQTAMDQALTRLGSLSQNPAGSGLGADVEQLERSAPDLTNPKARLAAPALESIGSVASAGVTTQAQVIFQLLGTRSKLDNLIRFTQQLHQQSVKLRQPLEQMLRLTIQKGEQLSPAVVPATTEPATTAPAAVPFTTTAHTAAHSGRTKSATGVTPVNPAAPTVRKTYDQLTNTFEGLSAATVPLSQEILALEQIQAGLNSWREAVNEEYASVLTHLLIRVIAIAVALCIIFGLGYLWRRLTIRYIRDIRRRRQFMVIRRLVVGFLTGITLIFGFVTQFSSLATFAGFITAGIAVGLQTILLSVAAYFFIIGRYGVRVGDRITIASVTGDVIEVGIVRFYVLEMAAAGTAFHPTGRVAVFSNAVLFQAGTPLYKQMPGTEFTWHQIMVKLDATKNYQAAVKAMLDSVSAIYETYRPQIERQHRALESWLDTGIDPPAVQSNLQLTDSGLQLWIRFPVVMRQAADHDEKMTEALLKTMAGNDEVKAAVTSPPVMQPAVK